MFDDENAVEHEESDLSSQKNIVDSSDTTVHTEYSHQNSYSEPDQKQNTILKNSRHVPSSSSHPQFKEENTQVFHHQGEPLYIPETENSNDLIFSSVSETRLYQPKPKYDSNDLDDVIYRIVITEPLLTENDLLFITRKKYTGHLELSHKILRQALRRNHLDSGYRRLQAYISGEIYE